MPKTSKMKGGKIVSRRLTQEAEEKSSSLPQSLEEQFQIFIKAKEIEGLRERTLSDHKTHLKYFTSYLDEFYPNIKMTTDVSTEILRDYINIILSFIQHERH